MKTYEEIIAENPNVGFFTDKYGSVSHDLKDILRECLEKPTVKIAIPRLLSLDAESVLESIECQLVDDAYDDWKLEYDEDDEKLLQECIDKILLKYKDENTVYNPGEEVNIDNLWSELKKDACYEA